MPNPLRRRPGRRCASLLTATLAAGGLVAATPAGEAAADPAVQVTTVVSGLTIPWDLTFVGDLLLYDVRAGQVWSKRGANGPQPVSIAGFPRIFANGEGGLLGMVADPGAASNKRFYTCQAVATSTGAALDVRVLRWRLTSDTTAVADNLPGSSTASPVVTGLPLSSGRHSGCRLRFGADGKLYVGTGDAAVGTNPQDLASLGGKVLRVGWDGTIPTDNPFYSRGGNARYIWTYGHRNVQGLAFRPGTNEMWSAEHGSDRDDEINLLVRGGNYGWDPVPGYDESRPMTDLARYPSAQVARWSSGYPTVATSGAAFLQGSGWGQWQGWVAVGLLKGQGISLMRLHPSPTTGRVVETRRLPAAEGFGRIRTVQPGPDGSLYFTTSNGSNDRIVRIAPTAVPPRLLAGQLIATAGVTAARTGSSLSTFVRSTNDAAYFRRSTDDARSWGPWTSAGVSTTNPPSAASSAPGRIDLFTRNAARQVVHTWYVNGIRGGSANLGGIVLTQHGSSVGDGTLDVWAVAPNGRGYRNHFAGGRWAGWAPVGGIFTSGLSASANHTTRATIVTGRGQSGRTHEQSFTPTGPLTGHWPALTGYRSGWSDRALGDTAGSGARIAVAAGADRAAVVERGDLLIGVPSIYTSAMDVVTRADGTFLTFGRGTNGSLYVYDARSGAYVNQNLGGVVR